MQLVSEIDPILRRKMEVFDFDTNDVDLIDLTNEMFEFIQDDGIGLAAPQVGLEYRLFIMKIDYQRFVCINPEILAHELDIKTEQEGCLSFPNLYIKVKRLTEITVRYRDEEGELQIKEFTGLASRCFQHELDHLNGITFDQKVSKIVLNMAKRRQAKLEKNRR